MQEDQGQIEKQFKTYFKCEKWQNAIVFAVIKTQEKKSTLKYIDKKTEEIDNIDIISYKIKGGGTETKHKSTEEETNCNRASGSVTECNTTDDVNNNTPLDELIKLNVKHSKKSSNLKSILRYIIQSKVIVRHRKSIRSRRHAICEESEIDRDIVHLILKKYKLVQTLTQYSLE